MNSLKNLKFIGNEEILSEHKIAFLCSRTCPESIVPKVRDWAREQCETGKCIISGFHSPIEKELFRWLMKGNQPIILVLARGIHKRFEPAILRLLAKNRLLIITPFAESVTRVTAETAWQRNRLMAETADEIFVAHAAAGGGVEKLVREFRQQEKIIKTLTNMS